MKKRIVCFMLAALFAVLAAGCTGSTKEQTFTNDGLSITLTSAFEEAEYEPYTVCYDSKDLAVFALKEDFETVGVSDLTVEKYIDFVIQANSVESPVINEDGLVYFEFEAELEDGNYTYFASAYKGSDAYWLVQFACKTEAYAELKEEIIKYAQSVTV